MLSGRTEGYCPLQLYNSIILFLSYVVTILYAVASVGTAEFPINVVELFATTYDPLPDASLAAIVRKSNLIVLDAEVKVMSQIRLTVVKLYG